MGIKKTYLYEIPKCGKKYNYKAKDIIKNIVPHSMK